MNPLLKDVIELNKVGPKSKLALNNIGIMRICDLLHYYPREYEAVLDIVPIHALMEEATSFIKGIITSDVTLLRMSGKIMVQFYLEDDTGKLKILFFNQPYIKNLLHKGEQVILRGKYVLKNNRKMFTNPRIIKQEEYDKLSELKLKPIYPLSRELTLKQLTGYVEQSVEMMKTQITDFLSDEIREKYQLATLSFAYEKIHYPIEEKDLNLARKRLVFDEFFLFQMAMRQVKEKIKRSENSFKVKRLGEVNRFISELPYKLTRAQEMAISDVFSDTEGEFTMTRLVQGDVGSGKTIIATISLLAIALNGFQGAFMAPTEVLAKQHYHSLSTLLAPYGIKVELLVGTMTQKQKKVVYTELELGSIHILIGTHALIQEKVNFKNLALVITDEQHRFGVLQRETLVKKGCYPHTLVMSATPIPRTLALIVYGDLDISIVNELPAGRKKIETYLIKSDLRERTYGFVAKEVAEGRNVYFVCPMVEDQDEESNLVSVESYIKVLEEFLPKSIKIGMLHGRMKGKEKTRIMDQFLSYDIQVLVSTTVIEVGVNIPNATIMVIENADRFGLAQLHQLRGRVGRSDLQSYCILISDTKNPLTRKKLKFLKEHQDGFELAEYDLKLRGPGDAFGTKQSGLPFFKLANLYDDIEILEQATQLANEYQMNEGLEAQLELFYYQLQGDIGL